MTSLSATSTPPSNQPVARIPLPVDCPVASHTLRNNSFPTTTIPLVTQGTQYSENFDATVQDNDDEQQQILATQPPTTLEEHPGTLRFFVRHCKWFVFELLLQHIFLISLVSFIIYYYS
jgi:hypothetical protein